MVKSCCAYECVERAKKGNGISFHTFPKAELMRKKWIHAIRRKDFEPTPHTRICSKHFVETDFIRNFGQTRLKVDAVPTIFNFSYKVENVTKKRKSKNSSGELITRTISRGRHKILDVMPTLLESLSDGKGTHRKNHLSPLCNVVEVPISIPQLPNQRIRRKHCFPVYFGDLNYNSLISKEAKYVWQIANKQITRHTSVIKSLRKKHGKLMLIVSRLRDLLGNFRKESEELYSIMI